jgi:TRAP-type C4-dicarboxylate transport system permease large subunit
LVLIEIGLLTPLVGTTPFVIHGIFGRSAFGDVVQGSVPYTLILIFFLAALSIVGI